MLTRQRDNEWLLNKLRLLLFSRAEVLLLVEAEAADVIFITLHPVYNEILRNLRIAY